MQLMSIEKGSSSYLAVVVLLIISLFSMSWVYTTRLRDWFLPEEYGPWRAQIQMIKTCDVGDVTILGDSRASVGYMPKIIGAKVRNLAMLGSTPLEAYFEMKRIMGCPRPPSTIVLSFSGYHFENMSWFWERSARYGLLDFSDLQEVARHAREWNDKTLYHGAFGAEPPPIVKNWLYANHFPPYDFASLIASKGGTRRRANARLTSETLSNEGEHLFGEGRCAQGLAWEAFQTSFSPTPMLSDYFRRIIALGRSHGATVLLTELPVSTLTASKVSPTYLEEFRDYLSREAGAQPGVYFVGGVLPSMGDCFFADVSHLNAAGGRLFSEHVTFALPAQASRRRPMSGRRYAYGFR